MKDVKAFTLSLWGNESPWNPMKPHEAALNLIKSSWTDPNLNLRMCFSHQQNIAAFPCARFRPGHHSYWVETSWLLVQCSRWGAPWVFVPIFWKHVEKIVQNVSVFFSDMSWLWDVICITIAVIIQHQQLKSHNFILNRYVSTHICIQYVCNITFSILYHVYTQFIIFLRCTIVLW